MSDFEEVKQERLPLQQAAAWLGISPEEVIRLAGKHRNARSKRNGVWVYDVNFIHYHRDPNR